jgi:hypothetical protein
MASMRKSVAWVVAMTNKGTMVQLEKLNLSATRKGKNLTITCNGVETKFRILNDDQWEDIVLDGKSFLLNIFENSPVVYPRRGYGSVNDKNGLTGMSIEVA